MTTSKRLLTITLNPSVDMSYHLDDFTIGDIHRVSNVSKTAGGKGLNVSNVAKQLGINVTASGFLGGANGDFIKEKLADYHIHQYFIDVPINTRNCINIVAGDKSTELLESSEPVADIYKERLLDKLQLLNNYDFVAISGSNLSGLNDSVYVDIIKLFNDKNIKVIVDVNAEIFKTILKSDVKIFMAKPNVDEAKELFKDDFHLPEQIEHLIISLGSEGLEYYNKNQQLTVSIPKIEAKNPVGSGDASIAGFVYGYNDENITTALITMASAGSANAMEARTGYINMNNYKELMENVRVGTHENS